MLTALALLGVILGVPTKYSSEGWEHLSLDFNLLMTLWRAAFSVQIIQRIQAMLFLSSEYNVVSPFLDLMTLIICLKYVVRYAVERVYLFFKLYKSRLQADFFYIFILLC